ncbi:uncharacterized protein LOC115052210 isoform X2 [Echeneis naucrates]|uniref:uncharacterized protein LOC115052210 isoform X2 n=1 Tax=Echeneis naucrates TaxID=173247 RepID=UPI001113E831|nr:uncharacterized protein LOC115052210 isoform X2 [Echeneis naucrates]
MNLYRSFGNLMEAWMTEGSLYPDSQSVGNNDEEFHTPSTDMKTNLRSESVDSGVETASSDTSFPATSASVSVGKGKIDSFLPEREDDGPTSASKSFSSSSSPYLRPCRTQESSTNVCLELEQAQNRTNSKHQRENPELLTVEDVLRRQPRASFPPRRHTLELGRGQRSASVGPRRAANLSVPSRQKSEMCRRPISMNLEKQSSQCVQELIEQGRKELSPGLRYLEQVCQMLEEIAKQQMQDRALQAEVDAPQEHQHMQESQALNTCQTDSRPAEEDTSSCQSHSSREAQQHKHNPHQHFRQRSASDTNIETRHPRKMNTDCRGQCLNKDDILEAAEESKKEESSKPTKNWKLKLGSLRREESSLRDKMGRQSPEKSSTRRRLSQLFRGRRKTLPV